MFVIAAETGAANPNKTRAVRKNRLHFLSQNTGGTSPGKNLKTDHPGRRGNDEKKKLSEMSFKTRLYYRREKRLVITEYVL